MRSALVIGGTGPTGPFVVNGLVERAYQVTVPGSTKRNRTSVKDAEAVLGDPFDYEREERLIDMWLRARNAIPAVEFPLPAPAHMYRHPRAPNDPWRRPSKDEIT